MTIDVYKSSDIFNSVNKKFFPYYALYKDLLDNTDSALFYSDKCSEPIGVMLLRPGTDENTLHISCLERRLRGEIFQHVGILNLRQTDEGTAHVRQHIGTHVGKCTRHILEFIGIFHTIPSLSREILVIILTGIMAGIEEVLLVIETHSIHLILPVA